MAGDFPFGDVTPEASHDGTCLPGCMAANCHPRNACWKMLEASVLNLYIYIYIQWIFECLIQSRFHSMFIYKSRLVVWNNFIFPQPDWGWWSNLTFIFFRGVETTNQNLCLPGIRPAPPSLRSNVFSRQQPGRRLLALESRITRSKDSSVSSIVAWGTADGYVTIDV